MTASRTPAPQAHPPAAHPEVMLSFGPDLYYEIIGAPAIRRGLIDSFGFILESFSLNIVKPARLTTRRQTIHQTLAESRALREQLAEAEARIDRGELTRTPLTERERVESILQRLSATPKGFNGAKAQGYRQTLKTLLEGFVRLHDLKTSTATKAEWLPQITEAVKLIFQNPTCRTDAQAVASGVWNDLRKKFS